MTTPPNPPPFPEEPAHGSVPPVPPLGSTPPPASVPPDSVLPPPTAAQARDNTQLYGILGIVLSVICCGPLGILFGYLSMQEAKKLGKDQTLGKVAFWLGIGLTALSIIAGIIVVCGLGTWSTNNNY